MKIELENVLPGDIERRSMELIARELGGRRLDEENADIIRRVIHTTADFDYADNLCFSPHAVKLGREALERGCSIVTDTQMARAGINKKKLAQFGGKVHCFMSDEDVAAAAKEKGCTRASMSMDKALSLDGPLLYAIGNAPTALVRLYEQITEGLVRPALVIGVPVGFVNVVPAKELIRQTDVPFIVARGRKGGSNVAAAICNALLYGINT